MMWMWIFRRNFNTFIHTLLQQEQDNLVHNVMKQNIKLTNFSRARISISFIFRVIRETSAEDKIRRRRFAVMHICII